MNYLMEVEMSKINKILLVVTIVMLFVELGCGTSKDYYAKPSPKPTPTPVTK